MGCFLAETGSRHTRLSGVGEYEINCLAGRERAGVEPEAEATNFPANLVVEMAPSAGNMFLGPQRVPLNSHLDTGGQGDEVEAKVSEHGAVDV